MVSDVPQVSGIEARLMEAASLPEMLAAGFGAFEVIRIAARDWQNRVPELFAAFMTAADAAVDGRTAAGHMTRAWKSWREVTRPGRESAAKQRYSSGPRQPQSHGTASLARCPRRSIAPRGPCRGPRRFRDVSARLAG